AAGLLAFAQDAGPVRSLAPASSNQPVSPGLRGERPPQDPTKNAFQADFAAPVPPPNPAPPGAGQFLETPLSGDARAQPELLDRFEPAETMAQVGDQYILKGELLGDANLLMYADFMR